MLKRPLKIISLFLAILTLTWALPENLQIQVAHANNMGATVSQSESINMEMPDIDDIPAPEPSAPLPLPDGFNLSGASEYAGGEKEYNPEAYAIVGEYISKRDQYSKTFRKEDGLYEAVLYGAAVHYPAADGSWIEVDNTLEPVADEKGETRYQTRDNGYMTVSVAGGAADGRLLQITKGEHVLSWRLGDAPKERARALLVDDLTTQKADMSENEIKRLAEKSQSHVRYDRVMDGVSLDYIINPQQVKEYITLDRYIENFSIAFRLKTELALRETDGGMWALCDGDEAVFYIPAMVMSDSRTTEDVNESWNVKVDFKPVEGGYEMTLTPDNEWLKAAVYPVVIDPVVQTEIQLSNIHDTCVLEGYPTLNYGGSSSLRMGWSSSCKRSFTLIRYTALPTIPASGAIVRAVLMIQRSDTYSSVEPEFDLYRLTGSFEESTATWNNRPTFDENEIHEAHIVSNTTGDTNDYFTWEITDVVRDWYDNANYGLLIKGKSTTDGFRTFYSAEAIYGTRPIAYIYYMDTNGIEGHWNYETASIGRGGAAMVNTFTGNLVYAHEDVGTSGSRLPVSIQHVFNTNDRADNLGYGKGWRLNYHQTVISQDIGGVTYKIYTDGDGTKHYFKQIGGAWKDEMGTYFGMTIDEGSATAKFVITDKDDNKLKFDNTGKLRTIEDRNGNTNTISWGTYGITQITDGAGRIYAFTYNANHYLASIDPPDDRVIEFFYDAGGQLTTIDYWDDGAYDTTFAYSGGKMTSAQAYTGHKLTFTYDPNGPNGTCPVSDMDESVGATGGGQLTFHYYGKETHVTDFAGNTVIYQFNEYGNVVCMVDDHGQARYYQYATPDLSDLNPPPNQMTVSSRMQATTVNKAINHSFEVDGSWSQSVAGTCTITRDTSVAHIGKSSTKFTMPAGGGSGTNYQTCGIGKGVTYTYSAWIKTSNLVCPSGGASIQVWYYDSQSKRVYINSPVCINGTTEWTRVSMTFTTPVDCLDGYVAIAQICKNGSTGTAWFDNVQLEKVNAAGHYNLLEHSDMKSIGNWILSADCDSNDIRVTQTGKRGVLDNYALQLVGAMGAAKSASQTVMVSGVSGDCFAFGGWAKADSLSMDTMVPDYPSTENYYNRSFGIRVSLYNGSTPAGSATARYNPVSESWQFLSGRLVTTGTYDRAVVTLLYENNLNACYFDGVQLFKEQFGPSYAYDSDGNVTSTTDLAANQQTMTYNTADDLTGWTVPNIETGSGTVSYSYSYDTRHNLLRALSPEGIYSKYTYDAYGNLTGTSVQNADTSPTMYVSTGATYYNSYNYLRTVTDARGKTMTYNYDAVEGELDSVVDPGGQTVSYSYDAMQRMTQAQTTADSVTYRNKYTYANDLLTKMEHNGDEVDYDFTYNGMRLPYQVKVGAQTLATYSYITTDRSYLLDRLTYGNDDFVDYAYDIQYRVTGVRYENDAGDRYKYYYNPQGLPGRLVDTVNGVTTTYHYDLADRLMQVFEDGAVDRLFTYTYNKLNLLTGFDEKVGTTSYPVTYSYNSDGRIAKINLIGTPETRYVYDAIGRCDYYDLEMGANDYRVGYSYLAGAGGSSTTLVSSIAQGGKTYSYTYDDCGRILSVSDGTNTTSYAYDGIGQLTRVNDQAADDTWTFAYDDGGNITQKKKYDYTTGTPGTVEDTITYGYDTTWDDKLTAYDGVTLSYDAIGNVTNDGTYAYTWIAGHQLTSMSRTGQTLTYKYNADGLRTQKSDGTTTTNYYWTGDRVTHMTRGATTMHLYYDHAGRPMLVSYNGTNYWYKLNLQGDVIGILNASGTEVVSYTYDAWGKQQTCTGSLASTLGADNPLRYRGYIYDTETGLYYLQARYYNPEWGRFVSADTVLGAAGAINTHNVFAYCLNDPVNMCDPDGDICNVNTRMTDGGHIGMDPYVYTHLDEFIKLGARYKTRQDAADAWDSVYRKKSEEYEYAVMIYSTEDKNGDQVYHIGETKKGMKDNVVIPFVEMYVQSLIYNVLHNFEIAAFVHTHPAPPPPTPPLYWTNAVFSPQDLWLLKLPGIHHIYVFPYENDEDLHESRWTYIGE